MSNSKTSQPNLSRYAKALGVSRSHLHRVVKKERKNDELLARYHALVEADPEANGSVRVAFLPAGTRFQGCTPEQLEQAQKEFGELVHIEGSDIELRAGFTLSQGAASTLKPAVNKTDRESAPHDH